MPKDVLLEYLENRMKQQAYVSYSPKPFVTISREYGCPANPLADELTNMVNQHLKKCNRVEKWTWINKQILEKSAKELDVNEKVIKDVTLAKETGVFGDFLNSLSNKYYPNEIKIRNTIRDLIRTYATKGNIIIVGRGGVNITNDLPRGLHIRLEAPVSWREEMVMVSQSLSRVEAGKLIAERDKSRQIFRESFKKSQSDETRFDMTLNCKGLSITEMANILLSAMNSKGFFTE